MTGELTRAALVTAISDKNRKITDRIYLAWMRVSNQRLMEFLMNAGWYSAGSSIVHPAANRIGNELLAQICEEYADFVTSRRPTKFEKSPQPNV